MAEDSDSAPPVKVITHILFIECLLYIPILHIGVLFVFRHACFVVKKRITCSIVITITARMLDVKIV